MLLPKRPRPDPSEARPSGAVSDAIWLAAVAIAVSAAIVVQAGQGSEITDLGNGLGAPVQTAVLPTAG